MDDIYTVRRVFYTCMTIYAIVHCAQCAPVTDGDGTMAADLNGQTLIDIGIKLNKPLLQLLGRTIERMEEKVKGQMCDLHPCTAWTEWSECNVMRVAEFGAKSRTRECGGNETTCETESEQRTEKVYNICVDVRPRECPKDYSVTAKGFCVKLYVDQLKSQYDAEQQCQKDGGHLISIDSADKYVDVSSITKGVSKHMWTGVHRNSNTSPRIYPSGGTSPLDFKWSPGDPSNGADELCMAMYIYEGELVKYDRSCSAVRNPMCEIV